MAVIVTIRLLLLHLCRVYRFNLVVNTRLVSTLRLLLVENIYYLQSYIVSYLADSADYFDMYSIIILNNIEKKLSIKLNF